MKIELSNVSKRFHRNWVFKNISYEIASNDTVAIIGSNGSGKSTLLKIISSFIDPTNGSVKYFDGTREVSYEGIYRHIGICSPELSLIEELTMEELLKFHFTFKEPICSMEDMYQLSGLQTAKNKVISEFSSGMKQRLKLLLSLYTKNEILLLDEPTVNMDEKGIAWYLEEIRRDIFPRTIIIASNQRYEYDFTKNVIDIGRYKSLPNPIE